MIVNPMDVLTEFPVRKTKKQKQAFREAVIPYLKSLGYDCREEKGSRGSVNMVAGDSDGATYLVTAHYDTCARMFVPNLITPCNPVTFLGYQLFVTVLLILPTVLVSILLGYLTASVLVGEIVYFAALFGVLALMRFGPANKNNANDNTSGVISVLEIAKALPENQRSKVCFVLFDLEEQGLVGSKSYRKAHKEAVKNQLVLNLDCVGDGDTFLCAPTGKLKKRPEFLENAKKLEADFGKKSVILRLSGFTVYPSDQRSFPYGVGISAMRKCRGVGYYMGRIHTRRDTVLETENIQVIRDRILSVIA